MFFMSTVRFLLHLDVVQPFSKSFRLPLLTLIISTIETLFIPILVQLSMVSIKVGFVILTKLILFSFIEIRPLHPNPRSTFHGQHQSWVCNPHEAHLVFLHRNPSTSSQSSFNFPWSASKLGL